MQWYCRNCPYFLEVHISKNVRVNVMPGFDLKYKEKKTGEITVTNIYSTWVVGMWWFIVLFLSLCFKIFHNKKNQYQQSNKNFNTDKLPDRKM